MAMNTTMAPDILADVKRQLDSLYSLNKETKGWLQGGHCPDCSKKELYTKADNPWVIRCGRVSKCGWEARSKELWPSIFEGYNKRYQPTKKNPNATADAYLKQARGFDISKIKGWYAQGQF